MHFFVPLFFGLTFFAFPAFASGAKIQCAVPKAPAVNIVTSSEETRYDYSKSAEFLTARSKADTSQYGSDVELVTHGLREDRPVVRTEVRVGGMEYVRQGLSCFWYDSVRVEIKLAPTIYIAKEVEKGPCEDAIMDHEQKHVKLDKLIMNKYAYEIGAVVKDFIDKTGAAGPYDSSGAEHIQQTLIDNIVRVVDSKDNEIYREMDTLQGKVDSKSEYMRISKICHEQKKQQRRR